MFRDFACTSVVVFPLHGLSKFVELGLDVVVSIAAYVTQVLRARGLENDDAIRPRVTAESMWQLRGAIYATPCLEQGILGIRTRYGQ